MATTSISGTNKLAERIVGEAEADARAMREEAEAAAREIQQMSDKAVSARRAELTSQSEAAKKSLISGYQTRATLDGKKDALRKKRAVIDSAFARAYEAVLSLDPEKRKQICAHMLETQTEGGETVVPAPKDRNALAALVAALPQKRLLLSIDDAKIDGGFILLGEGYEKDCSFRSLLSVVHDAEETAIYQLLFN
jgi:vacuolar-type H+-ATPase subunit E/Vma4